ncbi:tyrosine aminotransferase-like [Senna tora]|uniref:Tyrosine aminotransferase-like n=1 Tax=Senna tora TaxID=362788 RepID=A0A834SYS0_9FABA|nr:tyrosine aminotransferase-like [Senna tora]
MENNGVISRWVFKGKEKPKATSSVQNIREIVNSVKESVRNEEPRPIVPLGSGDPSSFPSFRTAAVAEDAIVNALRSRTYNTYSPSFLGLFPARRAVAEYLSRDLPYKLSPENVCITAGCKQAIQYVIAVLASPKANILIPRPGFPGYESQASLRNFEVRKYDLIPEKGWEVDLEAVESLADDNTVAMVIINPGNPCGNNYTHHHLFKVAETARKLGIMVIADEVYAHLNFGDKPFVSMGAFASVVPVVTLGSISKRWMVPGWRLGWLAINDPNAILAKTGVVESIKSYAKETSDPATFIQAAIPEIIEKTGEEFFSRTLKILKENADLCYERIKDIPCFTCPYKPEASMFLVGNEKVNAASSISIRKTLMSLIESVSKDDIQSKMIPLGHGDPSAFPCFRTTASAQRAIVQAVNSANYNSYCPNPQGLLPARRAVAEYLSRDLPYKLSPQNVYITIGCAQAIECILAVLASPKANILLPRPGFPGYTSTAALHHLEVRHFDLLPENGWEVDLQAVESLSDHNTVAMVIINPGNPCGNVYTHHHLFKVAETARKLGIMVIADEVYAHLNFGDKPFVPMATFASLAPVITLGSISKRWIVPGWRLGWLVTNDPNGILAKTGVVESIESYTKVTCEPATFIQGAIPEIIENTEEEFFSKTIKILKDTAGICYDRIKEIPCLVCPNKPEGSMFLMVDQLKPGTSGHTLTVKVVSSKPVKSVNTRGGRSSMLLARPSRPTRIAECLVGDETGTIIFTARNGQVKVLQICTLKGNDKTIKLFNENKMYGVNTWLIWRPGVKTESLVNIRHDSGFLVDLIIGKVDLMNPGATLILRNAKIDMFKGSMRLAVDKWGRIEPTEPVDFEVKEDNNLSLVEYELVNVVEENANLQCLKLPEVIPSSDFLAMLNWPIIDAFNLFISRGR